MCYFTHTLLPCIFDLVHVLKLPACRANDLEGVLEDIISKENINLEESANVFVARDTRPSSVALANVLIEGIQALKGQYVDYGM